LGVLLSLGVGTPHPNIARAGLKWWEIDVTWWEIQLLKKLGLARKIIMPS
jgi:sn-2 palmitoyl-lipid 9-desaturase